MKLKFHASPDHGNTALYMIMRLTYGVGDPIETRKYNKNIGTFYRVPGTSINHWMAPGLILTEIYNIKHGSPPQFS